jgi:3-oxoadipate enol-lactonase
MSFLERDDYRIAYRCTGSPEGPAVIFCHSLGLDAASWDVQAAELADRYRIVLPDMRGHGRSDAPPGPYDVEGLALDVVALADRLGVDRFHLVGLSIGGMIALWLAVHRPDRLRSAAFCNTAAKLGGPELWDARIAAVRAGGMASIADQVVPRFFSGRFGSRKPESAGEACPTRPDPEDREPEIFSRARATLLRTRPEGYAACCAALRDADLTGEVDKIRLPSLVVGASEDVATPPETARWLHARIPGSELVVLEGAGHVSNLERPADFGRALARHLDGKHKPCGPQ